MGRRGDGVTTQVQLTGRERLRLAKGTGLRAQGPRLTYRLIRQKALVLDAGCMQPGWWDRSGKPRRTAKVPSGFSGQPRETNHGPAAIQCDKMPRLRWTYPELSTNPTGELTAGSGAGGEGECLEGRVAWNIYTRAEGPHHGQGRTGVIHWG